MKQKILLLLLSVAMSAGFLSCATSSGFYDYEDLFVEQVAFYSVKDGEIVPGTFEDETYMPLSEPNRRMHENIWDRIQEIIPDSYEKYITSFRIFSDGEENLTAYIEPAVIEDLIDLSSWTLAIDIIDVINRRGEIEYDMMNEIIIHEFAHILSLNLTQTDPRPEADPEDLDWMEEWDFNITYRTYDVVAKEDSYLNRFFQEFWGTEQLKESYAVLLESDVEDYILAFNLMSIKYYTDFVSDYAMNSPDEDFAESFYHFVVKEKPEGKTLSCRKILFFYEIPEMIRLREEIRKVLPMEI